MISARTVVALDIGLDHVTGMFLCTGRSLFELQLDLLRTSELSVFGIREQLWQNPRWCGSRSASVTNLNREKTAVVLNEHLLEVFGCSS